MSKPKTIEQVKKEFRRKGIPIAWWADRNRIPRTIAYGLLNGRLTGEYGAAHRAAVLLGLKDGEIVD